MKLKPKEAAEILNVTTRTLSRYAEQGRIEFLTTPGGHRRYMSEDVYRFRDAEKE